MNPTVITVEARINAAVAKVWNRYTDPKHILQWNAASEDWHTTKAENDLRVGGSFLSRMEARDGSAGFNFEGVYDNVKVNEALAYTMADGRKASILFIEEGEQTLIRVSFDAETENPEDMQKAGWQSILDNFKKYTEAS